MKTASVFFLLFLSVLGCHGPNKPSNDAAVEKSSYKPQALFNISDSAFNLPADSANVMIGSYLMSIHADSNDRDLRSITIDADALRSYLAANNGGIRKVKLMFAHKLDYINAGHKGVPCGYAQSGLTLIVAGYDDEGNYVFLPNGLVIDHGMPCPSSCPTIGTAQSDLLVK